MKYFLITSCVFFSLVLHSTANAGQINQQLTCQAHLTHLKSKLEAVKPKYGAAATLVIKNGIKAYQNFLKTKHIDPGMKSVPAMQAQVDQMQASMVSKYNEQFSQARYFSDNVMIVSNCYKQYPPESKSDDAMVRAMIEKLAKASQQ
jgi:hypothetical protein